MTERAPAAPAGDHSPFTRIARVGIAGTLLFEAGLLDGDVHRRPDAWTAVAVVVLVAVALVLLLQAVRGGTAEVSSGVSRATWRAERSLWIVVSAAALVGLVWAVDPPRPPLGDVTRYRNDAIALNECGARLVLAARNPYTDLDLGACYRDLDLGPDHTTPLRAGRFAQLAHYPSDSELEAAWADVGARRDSREFVGRLSYPALTVLLVAPFTRLGWDPNALHLAFLYGAFALVTLRASAVLRPFVLTGLFGAICLTAFTAGGSSDLLYALPLVAAWLWREHGWSGLLLGVALATKQLAWFFVPYLLLAVATERGSREAVRRLGLATGVFAVANAPFIVHDPAAWFAGVFTPLVANTFPLGSGLVLLGTSGAIPMPPSAVLIVLTIAAEITALTWAFRARRTSPELGTVLALAPLFFATRSLFSYFFLIPLFAMAGIARMRWPGLTSRAARATGALTPFVSAERSR